MCKVKEKGKVSIRLMKARYMKEDGTLTKCMVEVERSTPMENATWSTTRTVRGVMSLSTTRQVI
jgi:hypothetical protein